MEEYCGCDPNTHHVRATYYMDYRYTFIYKMRYALFSYSHFEYNIVWKAVSVLRMESLLYVYIMYVELNVYVVFLCDINKLQ